MDTETKNIFREILVEEYQKRPKNEDIVALKKKNFESILATAHGSLSEKNFSEAKQNYFDVIECLKNEPYPDELDLPPDTEFGIKCCFCYSSLMDENFCENTAVNSFSKKLTNLVEEYSNRLFPKYLNALFHFQTKNWVMTLYSCNAVEVHPEEEENYYKSIDFFEKLLPGPLEIRANIELWQEKSFYGYGEELAKKTIMKPKVEKYLLWLKELENSTANRLLALKEPLSLIDLHKIFHQHIYPLWCETKSSKEVNLYYDNNYLPHCQECMQAKAYPHIKGDDQDTQSNFYKSLKDFDQCKCISASDFILDGEVDNGRKTELEKELNRKMVDTDTQTGKIKRVHKYIQTEDDKPQIKTRSIEVQVSSDSPTLSAVLDMKNKMLVNLEKKDNTISKLNKNVLELIEKLNKERNECNKKIVKTEGEYQKRCSIYQSENKKLADMINDCKQDIKLQMEKNVFLQKCFLNQFNDTFKAYQHICTVFQDKCIFMLKYLRDINTFLTPNNIFSETVCKENIDIWTSHLTKVKKDLKCLNAFYTESKIDVINLGVMSLTWPDMPEHPKDYDNVIFTSFIPAIKDVMYNYRINERLACASLSDNSYNVEAPMSPPKLKEFSKQKSQISPIKSTWGKTNVDYQDVHKQTSSMPKRILSDGIHNEAHTLQPDRTTRNSKYRVGLRKNYAMIMEKRAKVPEERQQTEKILFQYIFENCPFNTEEEVTLALLQVVDHNKGTLSNLPQEKILEDVKVVLRMKRPTAWVLPKSPHVDWQNDHTESNCSICFEEFVLFETYTLQCQHKFHKECIKTWLKTSSICPICRTHSVIDEEFPPLYK